MALKPTLWRTCRALANRRRLRLFQYVLRNPGRAVSAIARDLRMDDPVASQYLRILSARGLLRAEPKGRRVFYRVQADAAVPQAGVLVTALAATLRGRASPVERAFAALTGFTHPRRIAVLRALAEGPCEMKVIRRRARMSTSAAQRHLRKLMKRGYVFKHDSQYACGRPHPPLARTLMRLAMGG